MDTIKTSVTNIIHEGGTDKIKSKKDSIDIRILTPEELENKEYNKGFDDDRDLGLCC